MILSDLQVGDRFRLPGSPDLFQLFSFENSDDRRGIPRTALVLVPAGHLERWNADKPIWDGQTRIF